MCVYTHSASDKARTYIVKGFLKKKFLYAIDCETECIFIQSCCTFPCKKKKEKKRKKKRTRISCTLCV